MQWSENDKLERKNLVQLIHSFAYSGECPATSGNFSFRPESSKDSVAVSRSGVDKEFFTPEDFLLVDQDGEVNSESQGPGVKASDETHLHLVIYQKTNAGCVLHGHGIEALKFAEKFPQRNFAFISGMEMLKAFPGVSTHETRERLALFDNSQDIYKLSQKVAQVLEKSETLPGFILRGHGLYAWGKDVAEAKKHYEAFKYLFRYFCAD